MATPDLSILVSSAQVFSSTYTLPQIRAIHKALHAEVDDKAARLRTQVGSSYRELLGTADTIVRMRTDMDAVQATLGRMGGRCGRTVVAVKESGLQRFVSERKDIVLGKDAATGSRHLGVAARAKLLEACALAVGRVLGGGVVLLAPTENDDAAEKRRPATRGDRLVIAAKILVLSRLLTKSFGGAVVAEPATEASIEAAERSLASLRRRLLRGIDKVLEEPGDKAKHGEILRALSAYSLATSSGARDVLWHFLHVRAGAMAVAFETDENERARDPKDVLECLRLYTATLLDVQALVPHKLADALLGLKHDPLLADRTLRMMEGLRFDIYERWCGDEIQYYKPFIRHDDLDGKQAREMLTSWADKGSEVFLRGLKTTLGGMAEFKSIVELRTSVLQLWISEGGRARGFDPSELLDQIRDAINKHLLVILQVKVNKLRLVGSEVSATLEGWQKGTTDAHQSLWEEDSFDTDLSNGASQFAQDVIARLYGRNDVVSKAVTSYTSWFHVIDDVTQVVDQLKRQRWDNDVDEIEDEETIEHRQQLLSKDDPKQLLGHLHSSLVVGLRTLDEQLRSLWAEHREGPNGGRIAMYFIRILRDIRSKLPDLEAVQSFGLSIVPALHEVVASHVLVSPLEQFTSAVLARKTAVARSLWEGIPELPPAPSPGTFKFLRGLCLEMGDAGGDLWTPTAVSELRRQLVQKLGEAWREALANQQQAQLAPKPEAEKIEKEEKEQESKIEGAQENGESNEDDDEKEDAAEREVVAESKDEETKSEEVAVTPEQRRDLLMQWLFDISYLQCCLEAPSPAGSAGGLKELEELVYSQAGLEDAEARTRLVKTAHEYWKRTSLLFSALL